MSINKSGSIMVLITSTTSSLDGVILLLFYLHIGGSIDHSGPVENYMAFYEEEHLLFQSAVRKFMASNVDPKIDDWEEKKSFPSEIFEKFGAEGYLGILVPEKYGGVGGDLKLAASWCEEFGRVHSCGFTTAVNMHALVIVPTVAKFGNDYLREKWVPGAISGKQIGAYAFTEPDAGSDLTNVQTTAVKDGKEWVLNGSKIFITNGQRASFVIVLAKTDKNAGYDGYSSFVVDTSLEGFKCNRVLSKLGWHCSDTAELSFDDLRVPEEALLGEVGKGWIQSMQSLEWERVMLSLGAVGGAMKCLEDSIVYCRDRKVFGKSVSDFDSNRRELSFMLARLKGCQSMCYEALKLIMEKKDARLVASLTKVRTCELTTRVADRCLQLHGGYGYTTEFAPERWLRDLRLNSIGGGTTEILQKVAAKQLSRSVL